MITSEEPNDNVVQMPLRVVGRFTKTGEIEIRGDRQALIKLAKLLVEPHSLSICPFVIPQMLSIEAYDGFIVAAHIVKTEADVRISLHETTLIISGSPKKLKILAENIEWLATQEDSANTREVENHLHIEYHPDHFFLDPETDSLVVVKVFAE